MITMHEAINWQRSIKDYFSNGIPLAVWDAEQILEACDLAIEALEDNGKLAQSLDTCVDLLRASKQREKALKEEIKEKEERKTTCKYRIVDAEMHYLKTECGQQVRFKKRGWKYCPFCGGEIKWMREDLVEYVTKAQKK